MQRRDSHRLVPRRANERWRLLHDRMRLRRVVHLVLEHVPAFAPVRSSGRWTVSAKSACYAAAAAWMAFILACGGGAAEVSKRTIPGEPYAGADEALVARCAPPLEAQCRPAGGGAINSACIDQIADGYRALETYPQRQAYIIQRGCPEAIAMDDSAPRPAVYGGATSGGSVQVRGYYRRDGTYVRSHSRSRPR